MLFNRTNVSAGLPTLISQEAQTIYALLLESLTPFFIFRRHGHKIAYGNQVETEAKRIESKVVAYMNDASRTEAQLKASISSTLLTVDTVDTDIRIWSDGNPDQSPSWATYKASFNNG